MARLSTWILLGLLCLTPVFLTVRAQDNDDLTEEEVGGDDDMPTPDPRGDLDAEDEDAPIKASPDAEVMLLFTRPARTKELPAGSVVKFLVSFFNKGDKDMTISEMEASFRYPQDYNFVIQNYTSAKYNRIVEAGHETTLDYAFVASEQYAGRPLGLSVNVRYADATGKAFANAVFNETVQIIDNESAFNGETGFLYLLLAAVVVLLMLLGRQFMSKMRRRHGMSAKKTYSTGNVIETGTGNKDDVDFEWIPRQVQQHAKKSPGRSPPSARERRAAKKASE